MNSMIERLTSTIPTPRQEKERKGLITPLLNIPLENAVVDELHLYLTRCTDEKF